jgi:hypothetical protein
MILTLLASREVHADSQVRRERLLYAWGVNGAFSLRTARDLNVEHVERSANMRVVVNGHELGLVQSFDMAYRFD